MSERFIPSVGQRRMIAALALMPERQVLRAYRDPEHRRPSNLERVRLAAAELGVEPPTPATEQP